MDKNVKIVMKCLRMYYTYSHNKLQNCSRLYLKVTQKKLAAI